ncbi:ArsR family transcriptional regulator [Methanocalculus chunghsingensis]|uniref:ArsR family transcriptional regulator n=1 Tax=Methanocalculus chunghsingensis TaxID=156457 RepID=A0A8J7WB12_9EURY|nr:metalloregulator ArsR/SmtB family transcription factor [Methanocalculus chunghsingensis]MBR1369438.1 ArsR family transcriptional regulator [Methanocalculus chunghsingensis]
MELPAEIESSLCECGGITGLIGRLPPEEVVEEAVSTFRALADPLRLKILTLLAVQPLCVCVIRAVLGIADSRLSYHLSILKNAGLIAGEQSGNWIIYRLTEGGERVRGLLPGKKE